MTDHKDNEQIQHELSLARRFGATLQGIWRSLPFSRRFIHKDSIVDISETDTGSGGSSLNMKGAAEKAREDSST